MLKISSGEGPHSSLSSKSSQYPRGSLTLSCSSTDLLDALHHSSANSKTQPPEQIP